MTLLFGLVDPYDIYRLDVTTVLSPNGPALLKPVIPNKNWLGWIVTFLGLSVLILLSNMFLSGKSSTRIG